MAQTNGVPQSVQSSGPVAVAEAEAPADDDAEPAGPVGAADGAGLAVAGWLGDAVGAGGVVGADATGAVVGAAVGAEVAELELQAPKSSAAVASRTNRGCGRGGRERPTRRTGRGVKKRISVRVWSNKDPYRT